MLRFGPVIGALTAVSFAAVLAFIPRETWASQQAISLSLGVAAVACMGTAALLASRWKWIEPAFGGLDQVYLVRKWLGIWALVFALAHFVTPNTACARARPAPRACTSIWKRSTRRCRWSPASSASCA